MSPFKQHLLNYTSRRVDVPRHFLHGPRHVSVIHTQLRNNCSDLNLYLYNNHVSDTNKWEICDKIETLLNIISSAVAELLINALIHLERLVKFIQ